jgi:hypothetical protein
MDVHNARLLALRLLQLRAYHASSAEAAPHRVFSPAARQQLIITMLLLKHPSVVAASRRSHCYHVT